jgi:hypothetical protein
MSFKRTRHDEKLVANETFMIDDFLQSGILKHEQSTCGQQVKFLSKRIWGPSIKHQSLMLLSLKRSFNGLWSRPSQGIIRWLVKHRMHQESRQMQNQRAARQMQFWYRIKREDVQCG